MMVVHFHGLRKVGGRNPRGASYRELYEYQTQPYRKGISSLIYKGLPPSGLFDGRERQLPQNHFIVNAPVRRGVRPYMHEHTVLIQFGMHCPTSALAWGGRGPEVHGFTRCCWIHQSPAFACRIIVVKCWLHAAWRAQSSVKGENWQIGEPDPSQR